MGFPTWTLIGMGVTFGGAFVMVILAYIAQSPGLAARIGLGGTRIAFQVKTYTGYALALMLLFLGFFLAGVPLDPALVATATSPTPSADLAAETPSALADSANGSLATGIENDLTTANSAAEPGVTPDPNAALTPASGAFGGPPPGQVAEEETEAPVVGSETTTTGLETTPAATAAATATSALTPTPVTFTPTPTNSPTATATPSPTLTPTPTVTPTPIVGQTAVMNLAGGVMWLQRSPGGQNLLILQDREVVILYPGRANRGGAAWREIATGNGTIGWVEERYLRLNEN